MARAQERLHFGHQSAGHDQEPEDDRPNPIGHQVSRTANANATIHRHSDAGTEQTFGNGDRTQTIHEVLFHRN